MDDLPIAASLEPNGLRETRRGSVYGRQDLRECTVQNRLKPADVIVPAIQFVAYTLATVQAAYLLKIDAAPSEWWTAGLGLGTAIAALTYWLDREAAANRRNLWAAIYTLRLHTRRPPNRLTTLDDIPYEGDLILGLLLERSGDWPSATDISANGLQYAQYPLNGLEGSTIDALRCLDDAVDFQLYRYRGDAPPGMLRAIRRSIISDAVVQFPSVHGTHRLAVALWLRSYVVGTSKDSLTARFLTRVAAAIDRGYAPEIVGSFDDLTAWMAKKPPQSIADLLGDSGPTIDVPAEANARNEKILAETKARVERQAWSTAELAATEDQQQIDGRTALSSLHLGDRYSISLAGDIDRLKAARQVAEGIMPGGPVTRLEGPAPVNLGLAIAQLRGITGGHSTLIAQQQGNSGGAHYEFEGTESLRFDLTGAGALSAFFCLQELPTVGWFWHGGYGHDYEFLLGDSLHTTLRSHFELSPGDEIAIAALAWANGPQVEREDDGYIVSWISYSPTDGLVVRRVGLSTEGRARIIQSEVIITPRRITLY